VIEKISKQKAERDDQSGTKTIRRFHLYK